MASGQSIVPQAVKANPESLVDQLLLRSDLFGCTRSDNSSDSSSTNALPLSNIKESKMTREELACYAITFNAYRILFTDTPSLSYSSNS